MRIYYSAIVAVSRLLSVLWWWGSRHTPKQSLNNVKGSRDISITSTTATSLAKVWQPGSVFVQPAQRARCYVLSTWRKDRRQIGRLLLSPTPYTFLSLSTPLSLSRPVSPPLLSLFHYRIHLPLFLYFFFLFSRFFFCLLF